MALVVKDRVKQTTSTTGTGALDLDGNSAGFQTFGTALSNADTTYYALTEGSTGAWEVGLGTFATGTPNTLARTTVLASSNSGSAVNLTAGDADVFITQPAGKSAHFDASGNLVLNQDPVSSLQAATKQYVDTIAAAGLHYHAPVRVEHPSNLTATYDNGTSGVGATLTNSGTQAVLVLDSVTMVVSDRVLVSNQTNQAHNGVYTVTNIGSASTNWVLTRATDADSYGPSDPDALGEGDAFFIKEGDTNAGHLDVMTTSGEIIFGTTDIVFSEVAETTVYSAGDGLTLTGTTFAVGAGTGVTVNANDIAIGQSVGTSDNVTFAQVTADLVGNATTATAWETSRTVSLTGDVTGSATGVDGSGNVSIATTIAANSVALGTDTTGNYVADITAGNLIDVSGGGSETATVTVAVDLSELTTSTSDADGDFFAVVNTSNVQRKLTKGNINISGFNNDAGYTTNVGDITGVTAGNYVTGGGTSGTVTVNVDATSANTASKVVARDASGNFSAGTITATLSGNATTATDISGYSGTYWTSNNDGAGSGLDADTLDGQQGSYYLNTSTTFGGDVSGTYNAIVVVNDSHTHQFNNLTAKTSGTGEYSTSGYLTAGRGSGGVSLTNNDGYGNANITFNHKAGVPEQNGASGRIEVNTDVATAGGAKMYFELLGNVTSGSATTLTNILTLNEDSIDALKPLDVTGDITVSGTVDGVDIAGSINQAVLTTSSPTFGGMTLNGTLTLGANVINDVEDIYLRDRIYHDGDTDTYMQFHGANLWRVVTANSEQIEVGAGYVLMNDNKTFRMGTGSDYRQYFDGTNMIFKNFAHSGGDFFFQGEGSDGVNRNALRCDFSGANAYVALYYSDSEVLTTESTYGPINKKAGSTNGLLVGNAYASDAQFHGIKRSAAGVNDYMIVQGDTDTNTYVQAGTGSDVFIRPNNQNQARFDSNGYLYVLNGVAAYNDTNTYNQFHAADQWRVVVGGSERLEVKNSSPHVLVTGDLNSTSDARLKDNVQPIQNALADVTQLEGVSFDWKDTGTRGHGFIAQQVEPILPDVVQTDEETGMKSINYVGMIGHLVEAIKEQQTQIDELKAEVAELKG